MTEKIKVYIDTNMILDVFINFAKAARKNEEPLLPKKYEFMLANREKLDFVTSSVVKAEVGRELSAGFGLSYEDIETLWNTFVKSVGCTFVESFTFDGRIADFAAHSQMKLRTLFNFIHIFIAIEHGCYFITGDKDLIKKIRLLLGYERAIDYIGFRELVEGDA